MGGDSSKIGAAQAAADQTMVLRVRADRAVDELRAGSLIELAKKLTTLGSATLPLPLVPSIIDVAPTPSAELTPAPFWVVRCPDQ